MSSVLLSLAINEPTVKYILSCKNQDAQGIYLLKWLNLNNIALVSREQYANPDQLKPNNTYCMKGATVESSFLLFQVLVTSDWEDKEQPAPQVYSRCCVSCLHHCAR